MLGVIEVFREPLHRKYYAPRLSCAYLFFLGSVVVAVLVPFFLSYTSGSFWLKENHYREQPAVRYKYKLLQILEGTDSTSMPIELFFSTVQRANDYNSKSLRVPLIRSREVDENGDGLVDRLELNLKTSLVPGETVYSATLLIFFELKLRTRARIRLETIAYLHTTSGMGGRALLFDGDLRLRQTHPFQVIGGTKTLYESSPLLVDSGASLQAQDLLTSTIMAKYRARDVTTHVDGDYVWSRASPDVIDAEVSRPNFNITATVRFPAVRVEYTPDVAEVLKAAWMQYLSMLVVVLLVLHKLCGFVFFHQIMETRMRVEAPSSKTGYKHLSL